MILPETETFRGGMQLISIGAAEIIGYIGISIMCIGAIRVLIMFIIATKRREDRLTEIRIDLAKHLSLGLEFLVGKDIIETVIEPTFDQLLLLCFLIAIRTGISFILSWELKEAIEEILEEQEFEEALHNFEDANAKHKQQHKKGR